jgi:hypothetical protein
LNCCQQGRAAMRLSFPSKTISKKGGPKVVQKRRGELAQWLTQMLSPPPLSSSSGNRQSGGGGGARGSRGRQACVDDVRQFLEEKPLEPGTLSLWLG